MAHPHPHPRPAGDPAGPQYFDPVAPEPESPTRRRALVGVALASIVVIAAVLLMWQATTSKTTAQRAAAAASRACRQVEGLGQKCATAAAEEQAAPPQAVIPEGPSSLAPLPGVPGRSSGAPEETAAQAGAPGGPMVNPGDDRIVGLTVRGGRLEVTYADGSAVDAGRVQGAPPPIVLIVPSPAVDGRGPNGAPADATPASPQPASPESPVPTVSLPPGNDGPDPTGSEPQQTYVP